MFSPKITLGKPTHLPKTRSYVVVNLDDGSPDYRDVIYRPFDKQRAIHQARTRTVFAITGIGFGKTVAGVWDSIQHAMLNPGCNQLISAQTFPTIRDAILERFEKEFQKVYAYTGWNPIRNFKVQDKIMVYDNGTKAFFRSLQKAGGGDEGDLVRGPEFAYLWIDEIEKVKRKGYETAVGRIRQRAYYQRILITGNPRGLNWVQVYDRLAKEQPDKYTYIRGKTTDNPILSKGYVDSLKDEYDEDTFAQEVMGESIQNVGRIYKRFHNEDNLVNWDHILAHWEHYFPGYATVKTTLVLDPSPTMSACALIAHIPRSDADVIEDELIMRNASIEDIIRTIKQLGWQFGRIITDPNAHDERIVLQEAWPDVEIVHPMKFYDRNVIQGIRRVSSRFLNMNGARRLLINRRLADPQRHNFRGTELSARYGSYMAAQSYEWATIRGIPIDMPLKNEYSHIADCWRFYCVVEYPLKGELGSAEVLADYDEALYQPLTILPDGMTRHDLLRQLRYAEGRKYESRY